MAAGRLRMIACNGRRYPWEVTWYEGGVRKRVFKTVKADAKSLYDSLKRELAHAAPGDPEITADERRAVLRARQLGVDVWAAVVAHAAHESERAKSRSMRELVERRKSVIERKAMSKRGRQDLRVNLDAIAARFGDRKAADVTEEDAVAWIYGGGKAAATIRKRRVILAGLLTFGRVKVNVAKLVEAPGREAAAPVGILTPEEARRYLIECAAVSPELLAVEAIQLFAGLRRAEADRLDWAQVRLDRKRPFIEVTAGKSKTLTRRLVDVEPVLERILRPLAVLAGPVNPRNARRLRDTAKKEAGWQGDAHGYALASDDARPWPENALRHSFVSYHLAHFGDVARTEMQAGHDRKMLFQHYRELVTPAAARAFWKITL